MTTTSSAVIRNDEGLISTFGGCTDRFLVDGSETDERVALVEFTLQPHALAAPVHRSSRDDMWTYVRSGRIAAVVDGVEVEVGPGELLRKPRGLWLSFWNPTDDPAVMLEVLSPSGLEILFKRLGELTEEPSELALAELVATYGCEIDWPATYALAERHGVRFG